MFSILFSFLSGWASGSRPRSTHHISYGLIMELTEEKRKKIRKKNHLSLYLGPEILLFNLPSQRAYFATVLLQYFLKLVEFYLHLTMLLRWNKRILSWKVKKNMEEPSLIIRSWIVEFYCRSDFVLWNWIWSFEFLILGTRYKSGLYPFIGFSPFKMS